MTPSPALTPNILAQLEIDIDPIGGDDTATGVPGSPLKTWREYLRRLCLASAPFLAIVLQAPIQTVSYLNPPPVPANDPIDLTAIQVPGNRCLRIVGGFTATRTGVTLSAVTAANRNANQPWLATADFSAADIGQAMRRGDGACAWIDAHPGANQARVKWPMLPLETTAPLTAPTKTTIAAGNVVSVGDFFAVQIAGGEIFSPSIGALPEVVTGFGSKGSGLVLFQFFHVVATSRNNETLCLRGSAATCIEFDQCSFDAKVDLDPGDGAAVFSNCCFRGDLNSQGAGNTFLFGGGTSGVVRVSVFISGLVDGDFQMAATGVLGVQSGTRITLACLCDTTFIQIQQFGFGRFGPEIQLYGLTQLWGPTVGANGTINIEPGAVLYLVNVGVGNLHVYLTIAGAAIHMGGNATAFPIVPATGAFGASTALTVANFDTAIGGGGFGGYATDGIGTYMVPSP